MSWIDDHKGDLIKTVGQVWACGDDECGCTEAQVVNIYLNRVTRDSLVRELVWSGDFHTDWESGAEEELDAYRAALRELDPELERRIEWA
jgi:hypothetical protein